MIGVGCMASRRGQTMRKGVSGMRRIAAVLSVTTVALLATGAGAGAVTAPKLVDFTSQATGQVLDVNLQLPALSSVLSAANLPSTIQQAVAFSNSIGTANIAPSILRSGSG